MRCALNLSDEQRILSAWVILPEGRYDGMPIVEALPEGDLSDYLYINGAYRHVPLPKPTGPDEFQSDQEERIAALEEEAQYLKETLEIILSGEEAADGESVEEAGIGV